MYKFDAINHLHSLNGKALSGTTSVLSVISKGMGLSWWASAQACKKFGWLHPGDNDEETCEVTALHAQSAIEKMPLKDYLALLRDAYRAHKTTLDKTADDGKALHAEAERFIKAHLKDGEFKVKDERIFPFLEWAKKNVKRFLFSELHCYSEKMWTGGITDFAYEDIAGHYVLADIKSSPVAYFSHFVQAGAYDKQIMENGGYDADGNRTYTHDQPFDAYAIFPFGGGFTAPVIRTNTEDFRRAFVQALALYKESENFKMLDKLTKGDKHEINTLSQRQS